jgi:hypothetical protein
MSVLAPHPVLVNGAGRLAAAQFGFQQQVAAMKDSIPATDSLYAERVVGFIDILGFADLVRHADHNRPLHDQIIKALGIKGLLASAKSSETDLRAQNFSDSLILSANPTANGLWHLLVSLDALAVQLLMLGVLIRGGVTIGRMHHDEQIVFGVGVNEAYRLESTIATVPRIVLGQRAMEAATRFAAEQEAWDGLKRSMLLRDKDGVWHLNYLKVFADFERELRKNPEKCQDQNYNFGQSIRRIIQKKVDETLEQPDVYVKVEWIARYWNKEVVGLLRVGDNSLGHVFLAGEEPRA